MPFPQKLGVAGDNADLPLAAHKLPQKGDLTEGGPGEENAQLCPQTVLIETHHAAVSDDGPDAQAGEAAACRQEVLLDLWAAFDKVGEASLDHLVPHRIPEGGGVPRISRHPGSDGGKDQDPHLLSIEGIPCGYLHGRHPFFWAAAGTLPWVRPQPVKMEKNMTMARPQPWKEYRTSSFTEKFTGAPEPPANI